MDTIGLDLHKRESQLCILADDGTMTERRIGTSRERFTAVLGNRAPARILLEASTESEWVARHLEALGHTVIVADPNYAPMYATRRRRVKTDKRDARTLAEALRLGAYRVAHRVSAARRHVRAELAVREVRSKDADTCGVACLGVGHRRLSWEADRGGGVGASPRGHRVCDVARQSPVRRELPSPAASASRRVAHLAERTRACVNRDD